MDYQIVPLCKCVWVGVLVMETFIHRVVAIGWICPLIVCIKIDKEAEREARKTLEREPSEKKQLRRQTIQS